MTNEQLVRLQDKLMSSIQQELDIENIIKNTSNEIATHLLFKDKTSAKFMDIVYMFKYQQTKILGANRTITILIADMANYAKFQEKYRPYIVTAEIKNGFTLKENLQSIIESFFRHITGHIQPEILD